MKFAFNGATTMGANLAEDIVCAKKAGFEMLEIWKSKLFDTIESDGVEAVKELFEQNALKPVTINSIEQATFSNREEKFKECERLCELANTLNVEAIVVVPGFVRERLDEGTVVKESVEVLKQMARIAGRFKVKLGFEFLGFPDCSVNTLVLAWKIVEQVGEDNVDLIIDTCHFFAGGSKLEDLERIDASKIVIVHVNDLPKLEDVKDSDRLMPGDGILPLRDFFKTLRKIGYSGPVSVELFNERYWQLNACEVAREAFEKLKVFVQNS
ncbi:sugar phosphate isomerase/epimerase family protein [Thermotoga caldifontis]|uniref:sugar phosphate isomerase/epimerase family protein n=1 Tax=Thermotoga caldifontis TaxID=1508419 RepID=UPI000A677AC8|nr:sugar phosphate isomerase/epimerase [Thermotoga caldifontis]